MDRTAAKVAKIELAAKRFGLSNVHTLVADSTQDLPGLHTGSFDRVLLDPTCSALGLRPRLSFAGVVPAYLEKTAAYQRKLLHAAVGALKPGGTLVYSTCTVRPMGLQFVVSRLPRSIISH